MKRDIKDYYCVVTQEQANEAKELLQKYGETINGKSHMFTIDRFGSPYLNALQFYDQNWRVGSDIGLDDKTKITYHQWKQILIDQYEYTGMEIQFDTARGAYSGVEIEFDTANIEKIDNMDELLIEVKSLRKEYLELLKKVEGLYMTKELQPYQAEHGKQGDGMVSELKEEKQKYEVGKWYKGLGWTLFRCIDASDQNRLIGYGWNFNNDWVAQNIGYWKPLFNEATHEEVEQRFKETAKKLGYYDKPFVSVYNGVRSKDAHNIYADGYFTITGRFWLQNGCVFDNGKWAEFVKEPEYKIGEVYAFADIEKLFDNGIFIVSTLDKIMENGQFYAYNNYYRHIRKIEYKFID